MPGERPVAVDSQQQSYHDALIDNLLARRVDAARA
jgi:hypothetical protein